METAELATLIKTRRSIRLFQDKPVPKRLFGRLMAAMPRTGASSLSVIRK